MNASSSSSFLLRRGLDALPETLRGGAVAIGNFDGVHRGHQRVMATATALGRPALALTFEPHPRQVFAPDKPLFRLTPPALKARLFAALGLSGAVVIPFDRAFAGIEAGDFVERVLIDALDVRHVAVGRDFHFGRARLGTPDFLAEEGARRGFGVTVVPSLDEGDSPVSSTRIRAALARGEADHAAELLGYPWLASSIVRHGEKRGRTLGYPTANLPLDPAVELAHGVYAVMALVHGAWRPGVASFGKRPTFDDGAPLLEVYLFDFDGDLYGAEMTVAFIAFIRGEERFASAEALVVRMDRDAAEARARLKEWKGHPLLEKILDGVGA